MRQIILKHAIMMVRRGESCTSGCRIVMTKGKCNGANDETVRMSQVSVSPSVLARANAESEESTPSPHPVTTDLKYILKSENTVLGTSPGSTGARTSWPRAIVQSDHKLLHKLFRTYWTSSMMKQRTRNTQPKTSVESNISFTSHRKCQKLCQR